MATIEQSPTNPLDQSQLNTYEATALSWTVSESCAGDSGSTAFFGDESELSAVASDLPFWRPRRLVGFVSSVSLISRATAGVVLLLSEAIPGAGTSLETEYCLFRISN